MTTLVAGRDRYKSTRPNGTNTVPANVDDATVRAKIIAAADAGDTTSAAVVAAYYDKIARQGMSKSVPSGS